MRPGVFLPLLAAALCLAACAGEEGGCRKDQDCPSGQYCQVVTGQCDSDCASDRDCPGGQVCSPRGRCQEGCRRTNGGIEACDGVDNDCDGETDEELGLRDCTNDNQHGSCPGSAHCQLGQWLCDASFPGAEDCDGVDNDCDGTVDEDLDPPECPLQSGVCRGFVRTCEGYAGWSSGCDYGEFFEADELSCDDRDNDCDGETDEELTGNDCTNGNLHGECPGIERCSHGQWVCDGPQPEPESCDLTDNDCDGETDEGAPPLATCETGPLAADGLDNNCDGRVDEAGGCSIRVQVGEVDVYMDVYEATVFENPDCTGVPYGQQGDDYPPGWYPDPRDPLVTLYACSLPGILPSGSLSFYQAQRACQAQGRRLCTLVEWKAACQGDPPQVYPYGDSFQPDTCNTISPGPVETGSMEQCRSPAGIHDLSGNLWEWMADICSWNPDRIAIQSGSWECEYADDVECDPGNPDHQEEILGNYSCSYREESYWCAYPYHNLGTEQPDHGFRCCSNQN